MEASVIPVSMSLTGGASVAGLRRSIRAVISARSAGGAVGHQHARLPGLWEPRGGEQRRATRPRGRQSVDMSAACTLF